MHPKTDSEPISANLNRSGSASTPLDEGAWRSRNVVDSPRERILREAAALFRRKGYRGTTVRDIAESVGILSGSLFHHFENKEAILLEIMREAFETVCTAHEAVLASNLSAADKLRQLVRGELDAIVDDSWRDFHAVLYFSWREAPESTWPEFNAHLRRYQRCWSAAFEACAVLGLLRCDAEIAERIIDGALRGVMTWFRKDGRFTTEEFGDILTQLFMKDAV